MDIDGGKEMSAGGRLLGSGITLSRFFQAKKENCFAEMMLKPEIKICFSDINLLL